MPRRQAAASSNAPRASPSAAAAAPTPAAAAPPQPAAGNTVRNIAVITLVIGGPYAAYLGYMWLHLQSGFLRSPVATDSARQLLIVGTQSSGTTGTADGLQRLGLEVSHESSDATWSFARDGTVSWLHGLRFLRRPSDVEDHAASISALCATFRPSMGFHPAMFRVPRRGCSYRSKWDGCWRAECIDIVAAEWGCALAEGGARCETPFAASLLQVRHPLRTIESLAVKFCPSLDNAAHPHLSAFLRAILPEAGRPAGAGSCLETMGWFWARYNAAMLDAHEARVFISRTSAPVTLPCVHVP